MVRQTTKRYSKLSGLQGIIYSLKECLKLKQKFIKRTFFKNEMLSFDDQLDSALMFNLYQFYGHMRCIELLFFEIRKDKDSLPIS